MATRILIVSPVFRDQESIRELWPMLDTELADAGLRADWWLVDDGSAVDWAADGWPDCGGGLASVNVLPLRRNLGHQRALAVGLAWLREHAAPADFIVVMDADGEDLPRDVPILVKAAQSAPADKPVVFAERARRSEGATFQIGYKAYLALHRVLIGQAPKVGNFSVLPYSMLDWLVTESDLWNHYAATVWKARVRKVLIPTARGTRLRGRSHLNWEALVIHGLCAISCHRETIGVRLLACCAIGVLLTTLALVGTIAFSFAANVPFWAMNIAGLLVIVAGQMLLFALFWYVQILQGRSDGGFLPARDHVHYAGTPFALCTGVASKQLA